MPLGPVITVVPADSSRRRTSPPANPCDEFQVVLESELSSAYFVCVKEFLMNWKLSVFAAVLAVCSLTLLVGCEQNKKPDGPAPNTTSK